MTDFADFLKNVGEFGRFQKVLVVMVSCLSFLNAFHVLSQVLMEISVPHHCNTSWILQINPNLSQEARLNYTLPRNSQGLYEQCIMYTPVEWDMESIEKYGLNDTGPCQDGWEYDTSEQKSTLVTEFDLVCHRKEQTGISQSIFMSGLLIGALVFGPLGDRIGRRPVILMSMSMQLTFGLAAAFAPHFYVYMAFRWVVGTSMSGLSINNLVLVAEWVGSSRRAYATITGHICFAVGLMTLPGVSYGIRNWRTLQIVGSVPTALLFFYIWVVPESARWLFIKGKKEKAVKLLKKAASINKKKIPEDLLIQLHEEKSPKSGSMIDLFRNKTLRKLTLVMCLVWFVNSFVYYGLSLNVGSFGLNIYLTQLVFGAVEIPACFGAMFSVQLFGRKPSQMFYLFLGGTVCLIITVIPKNLPIVVTVLAVIGKFSIASSFSICYIYTAEVFPTIIWQNGVGLASMAARVAGIIAPLISLLDKYNPAIPMAIFGSGPIIGGIFCFLLPETRNKDLQDHMQQAEQLKSSNNVTGERLINGTDHKPETNPVPPKCTRL
ncbi:solute carrier family 22 member 13 [Xenopus laevis]|uniref:Solute carrier family 22 member 13 n=2 Tax=Xenopus laevis TaxID=8355 RepID=A0A1L8FQI1_XENLA|nr:solute carrier family 22 member 13 [Xenopus laevis]OCT73833.1 hypothetical protein XELAEV_18032797mg [Xenopus laevis]